ncbi:MAG: phosphoribosylglycinamide synthetase C domain-containing protein, partial [Patescibacteria group bacterium]
MKKLNFLFISLDNLSGDLAWRISKEGHHVKYYVELEVDRDVASGFIEMVDNYEAHLDWADVIIFDDTLGMGKIADDLRKKGKLVFGGTEYTDKLEDDRSFGQEELVKFGINVLPYKDFTSLDTAIEYIKQNPSAYVLKPTGNPAVQVRGILFIGEMKNGEDVIKVLEGYKESLADNPHTFQLQKKVFGVELAVGAFFNGHKFIYPINVNFEHKRLFPGDLGPLTGEMGTSMFWSEPNKIFKTTLGKFETKLAEAGFIGYIDLNCIVNQDGVFPLEFTCRFGYPTISIQIEGIKNKLGEFFYNLASGQDFELKTKPGFQLGVRLVVPPFPYDDEKTFNARSKGSLIYFASEKDKANAHIEDVAIVNGDWVVAGSAGVVMTVCGTGKTIKSAQKQAYDRIKNIYIPRMYYRNDIGNRWSSDKKKLKAWGYL